MDIYCPRCAEPWDNDMFHEVAEERSLDEDRKVSYDEVVLDFRRRGCIALGAPQCERTNSLRAAASEALMELGDMDGAMAELEDAEMMGLFREDDES